MSDRPSPLLVLSDLHLKHSGERAEAAFEQVNRSHPGHELVLAGDILDLSDDSPNANLPESISHHLDNHELFTGTLRSRLAAGEGVTWIPGNHDASIATPEARGAILEKLGLNDDSPLTVAPWVVRRGGVHIEHGHLYDPDNAPAHPLSVWDWTTEPVGVALTRQFLSRRGAWVYAHAYETTPLAAVTRAFVAYGRRAPLMICQYFDVAARLCVRANRNLPMMQHQWETGDAQLSQFADSLELPEASLRALLEGRTRPTHESFLRVFTRLYFDRVIATLAVVAGGTSVVAGGAMMGLPLAAAGALYLAGSVARSPHRIGESPEQRMRDGASHVRELTGASLVIMGHTHAEDDEPGYINLGSFGFSNRAAPRYLVVDGEGNAHRHTIGAGSLELHSAGADADADTARRAARV
jgi:predicted phosphodiesterase